MILNTYYVSVNKNRRTIEMTKFEECFDVVFDKMREQAQKEGKDFAVSPDTAKICTFMWNIMAVALNKSLDKKVLDDLVLLNDDYDIISFPIGNESEVKKTAKKTKKAVVDETTKESDKDTEAEK